MLPTSRTPPKNDIAAQTILLYGAPKTGKSTLCAGIPDALFLATEPGLNHLDVYQVPVNSWEEIIDAVNELAAGKHPFRAVVVDTVDNAYKFCTNYICKKFNIQHPADLPYGKGQALVNNEFQRVLTALGSLPYGLWLTSHARESEVTQKNVKSNKTVPSLPEGARRVILGMVDAILFSEVVGVAGEGDGNGEYKTLNVLHTKPTPHYEAGDRTGRLPDTIRMDFQAFQDEYQKAISKTKTNTQPTQSTQPTRKDGAK